MHFYAWKKDLKTGMFYLRSQEATQAIQITEKQGSKEVEPSRTNGPTCSREDGFVSCGSRLFVIATT